MVLIAKKPIRNGLSSSGFSFVVHGSLQDERGVSAESIVAVKFVKAENWMALQRELKKLLNIESFAKRQSRGRNSIIQPMLPTLVHAKSSCVLQLHRDDTENVNDWVGLVLESGHRNLRQVIDETRHMQHHMQLGVLSDLLNALHILEDCKLVHMDVKPSNVVATYLGYKLIDFDCSSRHGESIFSATPWTARYAAPEVAKGRLNGGTLVVDHRIDMWSFGMVAIEVFCGKDFWSLLGVRDSDIESRLIRLTTKDIRIFLDQYFHKDEDAALRSVVLSTLVVNPSHRCTASAVLRKSYFNARDSTVASKRVQVIEEIRETVARISAKMDDVIRILRSNEEMLTTLLTGKYMLPSLFVIVPSTNYKKSGFSFNVFRKAILYEYRLYFVCPLTKQLAKCGPQGSGYEIRVPKEWLVAVAPAIKFCLCAMKIVISAYGIPPSMIPTLGTNSWNSFGGTLQQCIRRDGGDAGERAFSTVEECFADITDASLDSLVDVTASLQSVTSKSFDQIALLLQNVEGASQPVHPSWRPKMTGLVEVTCRLD